MRFRDVGVQLEYDGDFKIYREDGISRYGKPDYLFLYFHTEFCVVLDKKKIYVQPPSVLLYYIFVTIQNSIRKTAVSQLKFTSCGYFAI